MYITGQISSIFPQWYGLIFLQEKMYTENLEREKVM